MIFSTNSPIKSDVVFDDYDVDDAKVDPINDEIACSWNFHFVPIWEKGSTPGKVLFLALFLALFIVLLLQIVLFKVLKKVQ